MAQGGMQMKKISYEDENGDVLHNKNHQGSTSKLFSPRVSSISEQIQNCTMSRKDLLSTHLRRQGSTESDKHSSKFKSNAAKSMQHLHAYKFKETAYGQPSIFQLPANVSSLLNEAKLWGCFYILPELYQDSFSPTVKITSAEELENSVDDGILTKDLIAACLSYLARSPITGNYVYIKLDLSSKKLLDVYALQHYRFLQHLDLSRNLLIDLQVLSHLPYLQYLSVDFNSLPKVLDYETPQWFLTEVHYRYNVVKKIQDLAQFWSITVLDLSHNNIKTISGLQDLKYLRKLDLSFNHITRLENLNHLRLTWLDISYNNISSFESSPQFGLRTLLHLEYLDINDNQLTSLKIFAGCSRLRELHSRNNRLSNVLELGVYMKKLSNLHVLDLRGNSICTASTYRVVVMSTLTNLLRLDDKTVDPVEQATVKLQMAPEVFSHATRRLLRLLYVEQLSRAGVSQYLPPADTKEVPIVVVVGPEACGKGSLCRRLAAECSSHVKLARLHTTATHHTPTHYHQVTHKVMDQMVVSGELLTYTETHGESYGLCRSEAFVNEGKVVVTHMDQFQALMLRLRHRRPYLLLATCSDQLSLVSRQEERKIVREAIAAADRATSKRSTLQVLVSGRIDVTGILNEIVMSLPEERSRYRSFEIASDCSLSVGTGQLSSGIVESAMNIDNTGDKSSKTDENDGVSLHSYSKLQNVDEISRDAPQQKSSGDLCSIAKQDTPPITCVHSLPLPTLHEKSSLVQLERVPSGFSKFKSVDMNQPESISSKYKGRFPDSTKSVTFVSRDENSLERLTGMLIESDDDSATQDVIPKSISTKLPEWLHEKQMEAFPGATEEDLELWCSFAHDVGMMEPLDPSSVSKVPSVSARWKEPHTLMKDMQKTYTPVFREIGSSVRDHCESLHRKHPGVYWDTLNMDNTEKAYKKLKRLVKDIVNSQEHFKPMFDINFENSDVAIVRCRRERIQKELAPNRLFH